MYRGLPPDVIASSEAETIALGKTIGQTVGAGDFLALIGELGSGKTTLVKGIAEGMGADPRDVKSPTFVLHHVYKTAGVPLHHIDCYRLGKGANLLELDLPTLLSDGAVVLEWADLVDVSTWGGTVIRLTDLGGDQRRVEMTGDSPE